MSKKETASEKKIRLLKHFEEYFKEQSQKTTLMEEDECFIVDSSLPKNTMILTNHETGETLKVKVKIENDELVFEKVTIVKQTEISGSNRTS
jgi:hypothetical protein